MSVNVPVSKSEPRRLPVARRGGRVGKDERMLPGSLVVLGAFRAVVDAPGMVGVVLAAAHGLAGLHVRRAGLSSARREPGVSDHHVVACVHKIDEIDSARAELVLEIDRSVMLAVTGHPPFLHTETVGAVIDRLAMLWVAMKSVVAAADSERAHQASCAAAELAQAYDDLIGEIASGRRGVPQW